MTPETQNEAKPIYAGFWKRLVAYIIDLLLLLPLMFFIGMALAITDEAVARVVGVLLAWPYFALCESSTWQGTVGKKVLGLRVIDLNGNPILFGTASVRFFSKFISGLIFGIGYFMAGFTEKKQALHDKIAGCLVVSKQ
jgi:uncharacterized RDD family membrane protein YckC